MKYAVTESEKIGNILFAYTEPALIDNVVYAFDGETKLAVASFKCEHYGVCIVRRRLPTRSKSISENDLKTMVSLANAKLDSIMTNSSWAAVFNVDDVRSTEFSNSTQALPDGFSIEFIPELQ